MFDPLSNTKKRVENTCSRACWTDFEVFGNAVKHFGRGGSRIFCAGGEEGVGGCYLEVAESMNHPPRMFQFENLNVIIMWCLSRVLFFFGGGGYSFKGSLVLEFYDVVK